MINSSDLSGYIYKVCSCRSGNVQVQVQVQAFAGWCRCHELINKISSEEFN